MVFENLFLLIMIVMASTIKQHSKKTALVSQRNQKQKTNKNSANKLLHEKDMLLHVMHPDYILFDWEFFSRELEFE